MKGRGERNILARLASLTRSNRCLIYDACPGPKGLLYNLDGYSAEESILPWMTYRDWGWKAAVAAASDIAASGGRPLALMYSLGVSTVEEALQVASGVAEAAEWMGVEVLKSDTNRSSSGYWIDVAVIGESQRPVPRSGARPGDYIIQAGYVGYGSLARLALEGLISPGDMGQAKLYTSRPTPPILLGPSISYCGSTASSDNSDGWAYTLENIAVESGVDVYLEEVMAPENVLRIIESLGIDAVDYLLSSWEDYSIAIAVPESGVDCILNACRSHGFPCSVVGDVRRGSGRVFYKGKPVEVRHWSWLS